ncbi:MAG: hypothetical protein Q7U07_03575 [Gammaproteobacteria bacterium]|nr:hypothetical protein [Gammaproteobacteria bacterium]
MSDSSVESRAETAARIVGLLCFLLMAGCAGLEREPPQAGAMQSGSVAVEPVVPSPAPSVAVEPVVHPPAPSVAAEPVVRPATPSVAVAPVIRPATPSITRSTDQSVAKTDSPGDKTPAKVSVPTEQIGKKESAVPSLGKQEASPPLDLASLEKRLRETKAIGVFTKIALKNQVDDLLNQFRAYYQGRVRATLAELRQAYDRLLLKVLSLLQDSDQSLARAIVASRDAIWNILADPVKFSTL